MSELKNQELPLEGVELYMQQASEFLANSAKMDDAPIPWMIAAAFKNEAENKRLRAELKAKDTKIAEANEQATYYFKMDEDTHAKLKAAESRLRAVLEFAEKRWDMPTFVARLRSIVEGK